MNKIKKHVLLATIIVITIISLYRNCVYADSIVKIKETLCKYLGDRYSNKIISLIHSMLETEERLRPDFISLENKLDSYK